MSENNFINLESDGDSGEGGSGGHIEFRDFLAPDEKKRLLLSHKENHEGLVKKQKILSDDRKKLKEGKMSLQDYRAEKGAGMQTLYHQHPILSTKVQFSGIDHQVSLLPEQNTADTNQAHRQELKHDYQKRHEPEATPSHDLTPKFKPQ